MTPDSSHGGGEAGNIVRFDRGRALTRARREQGLSADVHESLIDVWSSVGEARRLTTGQVLFLEGEPASHIYLVTEGRVESVHLSSDGRKFVSFEAACGDILGEAALIDDASYVSSAQAASQALVIRLRGATVKALLKEGGDFAAAFVEDLARRLCETEERAGRMVLGGLENRVANVLMSESERGANIVQLTHREIAERSGAARESVTQTLNRLRREGVLQLTRGAIRVVSVAKLAAIAGRDNSRIWLPLFKLLPAVGASAAACAAAVMGQPPTYI